MEGRIGLGIGVLALAIGAWNAWTLSSLQERSSERAGADGGAPAAFTARPRAGGPPMAAAAQVEGGGGGEVALNLDDPVVRERLAEAMDVREEQRDAERSQRFRESMHAELEAFASEEGLDAATVAAVGAEIDRRSESFRAVRQDVRDGVISWLDARKDLDELRAASDEALTKLLGPERFERLDARLWGERDRRPF